MEKIACSFVLITWLCAGCSTFSSLHKWERRAADISPGTPRAQVMALLPPSGQVVDLRSSSAGGPISYLVDKTIVVKLLFDPDDLLVRPVLVEEIHDKKTASRSTSRPAIRYTPSGGSAQSSDK